jgi:hypothetical protein
MQNVVTIAAALIVAGAASFASADILYSTSFEAPEFTLGPLASQDSWEYSFGTDPAVTAAFARTGDQSLVVSGTDTAFGQNTLNGPFSTTARQIAVAYSVYLGPTSDWSNTFITFGISAPDTFLGQLAIRDGSAAVLRPSDTDLFPTAIALGDWIDLELVFDFPSQTQEAFVNGTSIGSTGFNGPATALSLGQLFYTNFDENDIEFYVDDISVTAVPAPGATAMLAATGLLGGRRRR